MHNLPANSDRSHRLAYLKGEWEINDRSWGRSNRFNGASRSATGSRRIRLRPERERETGEDCETRVAELLTTHVLFSIDGVESVDRTLKFRAPDRFPFQLLYIQFSFSFYFNFIFHLFSCPGKNRTVSEFYFLLHGSNNKAHEFYPQLMW